MIPLRPGHRAREGKTKEPRSLPPPKVRDAAAARRVEIRVLAPGQASGQELSVPENGAGSSVGLCDLEPVTYPL